MAQPPAEDREGIGAFLAHVPLFSGLEPAARDELATVVERRALPAGAWLFRRGDPDDGLYVVRSGRVEVVAEEPTPTTIRVLGPGDPLGEMALFTAGQRSASARALRDTDRLRLSREQFAALIDGGSGFAGHLLGLLATKLAESVPAERRSRPRRVLAVVAPAGHGATGRQLVEALASSLEQFGRTGVLRAEDATGERDRWGPLVDHHEADVDWLLLSVDDDEPPGAEQGSWRAFCIRQADRVLCVAPAGAPVPREGLVTTAEVHLVSVSRRGTGSAPGWAAALGPAAHHVVEPELPRSAIDRLARRLSGRAVGLVLSGGGARGLAHLGVIDYLMAAGIDIDRVGGVSVGALIGGLFATGHAPAELVEICRQELVERRPFSDYTLPRTGIIRGRRGERLVARLFGAARFEDQERSLFCITADLISADLVVHRSGLIWPAVAASVSIPGFAPPRPMPEGLLVDGGVLNNLPVDVMHDDAEGPIIAVDVMRQPPPRRAPGTALPGIMETMARSTVLSSWARGQANRELASVVISPAVDQVGLLEWKAIDAAIDAGRRAADAALAGWNR